MWKLSKEIITALLGAGAMYVIWCLGVLFEPELYKLFGK